MVKEKGNPRYRREWKSEKSEEEIERERMDLEDSVLVVEKTRGSDDVVGSHGSELVVLEAHVLLYHGDRHLIPGVCVKQRGRANMYIVSGRCE